MRAYVGGYTTADRDGRGNGIHVYRIDATSRAWVEEQHVSGFENPSLFTLRRDYSVLYSVHGARQLISAFRVNPENGQLNLLNQVDSGGVNPVDSALDPSERFLIVPNYGSGNVAVLPLAADGTLQAVAQVLVLPGTTGPDTAHQQGAMPHGVIFDPSGKFVIVPDKGRDCVFIFRFDAETGRIALHQMMPARPGSAPRHCIFHPQLPVLFVNNELDSTVTVYCWNATIGTISPVQIVPTAPVDFPARNTTAEIAVSPDGRHLYVSNRGQDVIAHFSVAADRGELTLLSHTPTGGKTPRFFTLDAAGAHLFAANQDSDTIVSYRIDPASGGLTHTRVEISVGSPSAISLIP
ncbi:MAG: lactonase family protein [Acetobacteraceae bacterium]|nr:lactonase family protein [Acetobacteraceae bacterium]